MTCRVEASPCLLVAIVRLDRFDATLGVADATEFEETRQIPGEHLGISVRLGKPQKRTETGLVEVFVEQQVIRRDQLLAAVKDVVYAEELDVGEEVAEIVRRRILGGRGERLVGFADSEAIGGFGLTAPGLDVLRRTMEEFQSQLRLRPLGDPQMQEKVPQGRIVDLKGRYAVISLAADLPDNFVARCEGEIGTPGHVDQLVHAECVDQTLIR